VTSTKKEIINKLQDKLSVPIKISEYVAVNKPPSLGGGTSIYLKLDKKLQIYRKQFFDVVYNNKLCQSSFSTTTTYEPLQTYCTPGNHITNIIDIQPVSASVCALKAATAGNVQDALHFVTNDNDLAYSYLTNSSAMNFTLNTIRGRSKSPQNYLFREPSVMQGWNREKQALWITGKTGFGKTQYAKSLFTNGLFVRNVIALKLLNATHDGIVFDNVSFEDYSIVDSVNIIDVENECQITIEDKMIIIPKRLPRVFTSNGPIFNLDESIKRLLYFVDIKDDIRIMDPSNAVITSEPPSEFFCRPRKRKHIEMEPEIEQKESDTNNPSIPPMKRIKLRPAPVTLAGPIRVPIVERFSVRPLKAKPPIHTEFLKKRKGLLRKYKQKY